MSGLFNQIELFFQQSPGNVVYHLVLLFSLFTTFQSIWINQRNSRFLHIKRLRRGLSVLLIGQGLMLAASLFSWLIGISPQSLLPTLDRAVIVLSLMWIIWLWMAPKPSLRIDRVMVGVSIFLLLLWVISLVVWFPQSEKMEFNTTGMALGWDILLCVFSIAGIVVIFRKRPFIWSFGFVFCILMFIGGILQITFGNLQGNFAGILRLFLLVAFPLLPFLAMRLYSPPVAEQTGEQARMYRERRRYSADPRTLLAWLQSTKKLPEGTLPSNIARAVGQTMLADICYLILAPRQQDDLIFLCGYDLIREVELPGFSKSQTLLPALSSSVQRAKPYIHNIGSNPIPELDALADAVDLRDAANTMFVPLANSDITWGGILLLSPFAERIWTQEDLKYLQGLNEYVLQTLLNLQQKSEVTPDSDHLKTELQTKQTELDELQGEFRELLLAFNELQLLEDSATATRTVNPLQNPVETEEEIFIPAISQIPSSSEEVFEYFSYDRVEPVEETSGAVSQELQLTLEELSNLQGQLTEARTKISKLEKQVAQQPETPPTCSKTIITTAQELRHPLSGLIGYIDILASETAGDLNEVQRTFLDRIKIAAGKLHAQLEDLIQQTTHESNEISNTPSQIELIVAIDQAVSEAASTFLEKDITFRMDVSNDIPTLELSKDALTKILNQLLQNAILASPAGNTVILKANCTSQDIHDFVLIQVSDSGTGLTADEIALLQSQTIPGDTIEMAGLGIPVKEIIAVQNLVRKLCGRLWVDSQESIGTTFSVLLPVKPGVARVMENYDKPEG